MTGKKLVTLTLIMLLVMALMGGLAAAEDECPSAPAVAVQILQDNDIDFRYEAEEVEHRNGTMRTLYENYISMVAQTMANEAAFPAYECNGEWDGETYIDKCNEEAYYWAVYNYLRFLGADLEAIYTTYEQEGTFTSIRYLPGVWNYDITIAKDCNDEFAWGTITLIDPNNEKVEAVIEEIKYDYAYWSSYVPNLAAVGNVTYLNENYNFMFLYAEIALWMGISDQEYTTYWNSGSVFLPASIRVYDIHSELTNDFHIFW